MLRGESFDLAERVGRRRTTRTRSRSGAAGRCSRPLDPPEVWCSASPTSAAATRGWRRARSSDVYDLVYEAARPELFLKDAGGRRTVGPGAAVGIRSDSGWDVPEPEIGLVARRGRDDPRAYDRQRRLVARDRGREPALPEPGEGVRRRLRDRPGARRASRRADGYELVMRITRREGRARSTRTRRRRRRWCARSTSSPSWLVRDNPVPPGTVLLTGTGLVPPDSFTLEPGQTVAITVNGIGTLVNSVVPAATLVGARTEGARTVTETTTDMPARNYVAGEWRVADAHETYERVDPWRPSRITGVYQSSGADDVNAAAEAAADAFRAWAALPAPSRATFLLRAADALEARTEQIALDMTAEMGKPLRESRLEAARAATILRFAAGEAWRPIGEVFAASVPLQRLYTVRRPAGRRRADHPMELPDRDPCVEARAGADSREYRRLEARARRAPHRASRRRVLCRGRPPGGGAQRAHGLRLDRRRGARRAARTSGRSRSPAPCLSATACATARRLEAVVSSSSSEATTRSS